MLYADDIIGKKVSLASRAAFFVHAYLYATVSTHCQDLNTQVLFGRIN